MLKLCVTNSLRQMTREGKVLGVIDCLRKQVIAPSEFLGVFLFLVFGFLERDVLSTVNTMTESAFPFVRTR